MDHPYNTNGKYFFDPKIDDDTLLQVTTVKKGKKNVQEAKVFGLMETMKDKKGREVNINRKNFCDGFRRLFLNLNDRLVKMDVASKKYKKTVSIKPLTINDFKATSYDLIRVFNKETNRETEALFPVDFEAKNAMQFNGEDYKVSINIDNPTTLEEFNMEGGPQGTHFGYSLKPLKGGEIIGHVLINTFVGFPSRNKRVMEDMKYLSTNDGIKHFKFSELNNILSNNDYVIDYDLVSTKGRDKIVDRNDGFKSFPIFEQFWE